MQEQNVEFATLNLFKDTALSIPDANIRFFPGIAAVLKLLKRQSLTVSYDKSTLTSAASVEWASGAFLAFKPAHYAKLHGFAPQYFMYFEDVDICYRSKKYLVFHCAPILNFMPCILARTKIAIYPPAMRIGC